MPYLESIVINCLILAVSGLSVLLIMRDLRSFPLHVAASFGVGAYIAALVLAYAKGEVIIAIVAALIGGCIFGLVAGAVTCRVPLDRQLLIYLALQIGFEVIARLWVSVTGGAAGLNVTRELHIGAIPVSIGLLPGFTIVGLLIVGGFAWTVQRVYGPLASLVGCGAMHAEGLGVPVRPTWVCCQSSSSSLLAGCGALYAIYVGYVSPGTAGINRSVWVILVAVLGANRAVVGTAIGAFLVVCVSEIVGFVSLPVLISGQIQQLLTGVALACVVLIRGRSIFGN